MYYCTSVYISTEPVNECVGYLNSPEYIIDIKEGFDWRYVEVSIVLYLYSNVVLVSVQHTRREPLLLVCCDPCFF